MKNETAKTLGLADPWKDGFYEIPAGYQPVGYVPDSGDIGFKVYSVGDGRYLYRVKTWDCPDGLTEAHELRGIVPKPAVRANRSPAAAPVVYDDYGNPIYGDGEELL